MGWMDLLMGTLGVAGAGGSIYSAIQQQNAYEKQQKFARQQRQVQEQQLGIQRQQLTAEQARRGRLETLSQQPLDVNQFYAPMSAAETAALRRSISADLASRGIPFDSSYATNLAGEIMAKTESQRQQFAMQQAQQARGQAQAGLAQSIPGFYAPGAPGGPPGYPGGDFAGSMSGPLAYFINKYGQAPTPQTQAGRPGGAGAARYNPPGMVYDPDSQYSANPQDAWNQRYLPRVSAGLEGQSGTIGPGNPYGSNYYPIEDPSYTGAAWGQPGGGRGMSGLPGLGY